MSTSPMLSIVIPTRNRAQTLKATLQALDLQQAPCSHGSVGQRPGWFEVIVADDGSTDDTGETVSSFNPETYKLRLVQLTASGPAAARNRGAALAAAGRILLLGDDTLPEPGTLTAHLECAAGRQVAVQGHIDWDPSIALTREMMFLAPEGPQFYFKGLVDNQQLDYWNVLGSNMSAPASWFQDEPFDERFRHACLEDTEMAWRWSRRGRVALYSRQARCLHRHSYGSMEPFFCRQRRAGHESRQAVRLHPALIWRLIALPLIVGLRRLPGALVARMQGRLSQEQIWDLRCRSELILGFLGRSRPATS